MKNKIEICIGVGVPWLPVGRQNAIPPPPPDASVWGSSNWGQLMMPLRPPTPGVTNGQSTHLFMCGGFPSQKVNEYKTNRHTRSAQGPGISFHKCETKYNCKNRHHCLPHPHSMTKLPQQVHQNWPSWLLKGGKNRHRWGMAKKKMPGTCLAHQHSPLLCTQSCKQNPQRPANLIHFLLVPCQPSSLLELQADYQGKWT